MEKRKYEALKAIRERVKNGSATFAERNIYNMEEKRKRKELASKTSASLPVKGGSRFGGR